MKYTRKTLLPAGSCKQIPEADVDGLPVGILNNACLIYALAAIDLLKVLLRPTACP